MADQSDVDWDTCAAHGCVGVRLPTAGRCWAHAADGALDTALEQIAAHGRLDVRGVRVTTALLERVLGALPHDDHGRAILTDARFDRAVFQGDVSLARVTFEGEAWFDHATFQGDARFDRATFQRSRSAAVSNADTDLACPRPARDRCHAVRSRERSDMGDEQSRLAPAPATRAAPVIPQVRLRPLRAWKRRVLAPGAIQPPCSEGVVELPPRLVQRRGAYPQAVGAQDADRDAKQEQQLGLPAGALWVDADGVGGGCGVGVGELAVGDEQQPVAAVGEVGERVEAGEQR
jgi:pentapeptide repeat protein